MNKSDYVLILFYRLMNGERIKKNLFMKEFEVGRRSFDRYIQTVRLMLSDVYAPNEVCYDVKNNEYYLSGLAQGKLHGIKILPPILLMLESGALSAKDTVEILTEFFSAIPMNERTILQRTVQRLTSAYEFKVSDSILKVIWDLNLIIDRGTKIFLIYENENRKLEREKILPEKISCSDGEWILQGITDSGMTKYFLIKNICKIENV